MTRIVPGTAAPTQTSIDDIIPDRRPRNPGAARRAAPDARALCAELLRWEGCCQHMSIGTRGIVTTGIGHSLPNAEAALALPWRHRATGQPATAAEVRAAFERVCAKGPGHSALAYRLASDLVLPPGVAGDLAIRRLEREFLPALRRLCPNFDRYPAPAQRALVDMAYNLGVGGLSKFHNLLAACERGDFATAADHCVRRASRPTRNAATRNLFLEAVNPDRPGQPGRQGRTVMTTAE